MMPPIDQDLHSDSQILSNLQPNSSGEIPTSNACDGMAPNQAVSGET